MNSALKFLGIVVIVACVENLHVKSDDSQCISCESGVDGQACVSYVNLLGVCARKSNKCYTTIVDGKVFRGCIGDALVPNEQMLQHCIKDKRCDMCDGDLCNKYSLKNTCIHCDSSKNVDCKEKPGNHMQAVCSVEQTMSSECYLDVSGGIYKRGCTQELGDEKLSQCEDNRNCQICTSPNCNQKVDFNMKCYECDGETNGGCAQGENLEEIECRDLSHTCVVGVNDQGHTKRMCIPNDGLALALTFPKGYAKCHENLCNNQPFTPNLLKCYQCDGSKCKELKSIEPKACASGDEINLGSKAQCYTYVKGDDHYRGCMSDSSKGKTLCAQDRINCHTCSDSACNKYVKSVSSRTGSILWTILMTIASLPPLIR